MSSKRKSNRPSQHAEPEPAAVVTATTATFAATANLGTAGDAVVSVQQVSQGSSKTLTQSSGSVALGVSGLAGGASSATAGGGSTDAATGAANLDLADHIEKIQNGTHSELHKRTEKLRHELDRRIAIADRHRKMQIKNINELFDFEVEDAKSRFQIASAALAEQLTAELQQESQRQRLTRSTFTHEPKRAAGEGGGPVQAGGGGVVGGGGGGSNDDAAGTAAPAAERSLRSVVGKEDKDKDGSTTAGSSALPSSVPRVDGKNGGGASAPNPKKRPAAQVAALEKCLKEEDMRADFYSIVRDLESRATAYAANCSKLPKHSQISIDENGRLQVGGVRYCVGDLVSVTSSLSGESFTGVLTVIAPTEVILRSVTGPRFSFLVGMLKSGRINISADTDTIQTLNRADAKVMV